MEIRNLRIKKLIPAERQICMKEGRCFRCCEEGHNANKFPKPGELTISCGVRTVPEPHESPEPPEPPEKLEPHESPESSEPSESSEISEPLESYEISETTKKTQVSRDPQSKDKS